MRTIKRAVHVDFHTMPDIPDFGADFDAKAFAKTLKDARVEYVNVFAKCNIGFAYYPTDIGVMHPHLKFDMFGQIVEECRKVGIGVTAYFNAGLDHEMAKAPGMDGRQPGRSSHLRRSDREFLSQYVFPFRVLGPSPGYGARGGGTLSGRRLLLRLHGRHPVLWQ